MSGWYDRLEERRRREGLSKRALADRLGLASPQTIYNWALGSNRPARAALERIAAFLGEPAGDLAVELSTATGAQHDELIAALTARRLNAQWHRAHLRDVRSLLGMPDQGGQLPEPETIDLVLPLLRQRLPNCPVSFLLSRRGTRLRAPYEYLVHVDRDLAADRDEQPPLGERVERALAGVRGPAWWDRSADLLPASWDPSGVTFTLPRLLDSRPPDWLDLRYRTEEGVSDLFVLSVYHGGAPDVGALLAPCLGFGYNIITTLAAQLGSWTMSPLRTSREVEAQVELARAITQPHSPIAGPNVWAVNDPEPVLDAVVRENLSRRFAGRVVLLELARDALAYAAWHVATAEALPDAPAPARVLEHLELLAGQQTDLARVADGLEPVSRPAGRVLRLQIRLPGEALRRPDGGYPDAEDAFFDLWAAAALRVRGWLDRFAAGGQVDPGPARLQQLVREDDLLGPLVHRRRTARPPAARAGGTTPQEARR